MLLTATAVDDSYTIPQGEFLETRYRLDNNLLQNDTPTGRNRDADGNRLQVSLVSGPSHGTLHAFRGWGGFDYTSDADFVGIDSFVYEITDGVTTSQATATIEVTGDFALSAAVDDVYTVVQGEQLEANFQYESHIKNLLFNDTPTGSNIDEDGDRLTVSIVSGPYHGTIDTLRSWGGFDYTSGADFVGTDSFVYEISDGVNTSQATATIEVLVGNTAPEFVFPESEQDGEVDEFYSFSFESDQQASIGAVFAEDADGDEVTYSTDDAYFTVHAMTGEVTIVDLDYVHSVGFPDSYTFTITASDGDLQTPADVTLYRVEQGGAVSVTSFAGDLFEGADHVDEMTFATTADFLVEVAVPATASTSRELLIAVYADGVQIDSRLFSVAPGEEYSEVIKVPILEANYSIGLGAAFADDLNIGLAAGFADGPPNLIPAEQFDFFADQPVAKATIDWWGHTATSLEISQGEVKEAANSSFQSGIKSLFTSQLTFERYEQAIKDAGGPLFTDAQARAQYNEVVGEISVAIGNRFKPAIDSTVDDLLMEIPALEFKYAAPYQEHVDRFLGLIRGVPTGVVAVNDASPATNAAATSLLFELADPGDIISAIGTPLLENVGDAIVSGEFPDGGLLNGLDLGNVTLIKQFGLTQNFDLTPGNTTDSLGTAFIGLSDISINSLTNFKKQAFEFSLAQPLITLPSGQTIDANLGVRTSLDGESRADFGVQIDF